MPEDVAGLADAGVLEAAGLDGAGVLGWTGVLGAVDCALEAATVLGAAGALGAAGVLAAAGALGAAAVLADAGTLEAAGALVPAAELVSAEVAEPTADRAWPTTDVGAALAVEGTRGCATVLGLLAADAGLAPRSDSPRNTPTAATAMPTAHRQGRRTLVTRAADPLATSVTITRDHEHGLGLNAE